MGQDIGVIDGLFHVEMCIIVAGVDTCVGTTAACDGHRLSQLEAQTLLHRGLHTLGVRLYLVTVIAAAIIGHVDEISWHRSILCRKNT